LTHAEAEQVLNSCHSSAYGGHLSCFVTSHKIMRAGYFWPSLFSDCIETVKHCSNCQHFTPKARASPAPLHPV
ncbi:hypothetical protein HJW54_22640, partial [Bacteroides uniformis]|nr:hypothetical protein [Bacteroides uniformis]